MRFSPIAALAVSFVACAQAEPITTWLSTAFIDSGFSTSRLIQYGSSAVTPVLTTTAPFVMATSYVHEPTFSSRNINHTIWATVTITLPLTTDMSVVYISPPPPPPIVTRNTTVTDITYITTIVATVTLPATTCDNGILIQTPKTTLTKYTGKYTPLPGGQETTPTTTTTTTHTTAWPTAVTSYFFFTTTWRVFAFTGSTTTVTSTATRTAWLTTTMVTTTLTSYPYTFTRYAGGAVTLTKCDYQLAYTALSCNLKPTELTPPPPQTTATETYAAQCAPGNLISERAGYGVAVRVLPEQWSFPVGFPGPAVIGIPGLEDGSACCQLCADNEGCAASEWRITDGGGCSLYYYNKHESPVLADIEDGIPGRNRTCGDGVPLEYYADEYALPGQGSYIQAGCGLLEYLGVVRPF
ncbi:hypothetical protein B0H63DRAFT_520728 [Podospora didyma]|uniref:Apple domain-containing protein n=1 Tax=Podospora didyma TaxID=330526 RepID=A0AAE0U111_9PEZI|nr:hypothetical protein B0H63DRAFT_520728 [Podospora didyma]